MAGYNEGLCEDRHRRIDERFAKGEHRMDTHERTLTQHNEQLAIMREIAERSNNAFWRIMTPILSIAAAVVSGLVLAWCLNG